jgi:hypothetical protein
MLVNTPLERSWCSQFGAVHVDNKQGGRIQNRKELVKRWVAAYPEQLRPKLLIGRYHKEGAHDWWQKAELPAQAFWGGEIGAALITRHLRPEAVTIYSETNLAKLQAQQALRRDSNGETELLRRFWAFDKWDEQNKHVVPPLLIYADLIRTANDRNLELLKSSMTNVSLDLSSKVYYTKRERSLISFPLVTSSSLLV